MLEQGYFDFTRNQMSGELSRFSALMCAVLHINLLDGIITDPHLALAAE
jgi:hypothetical protein